MPTTTLTADSVVADGSWATDKELGLNPLDRYLTESYEEIRGKARRIIRRFEGAITLQPTAVVHEAIVKIWGSKSPPENRKAFMIAVSRAMRDVLIDNYRKRLSLKRGNGKRAASLGADVSSGSSALLANKRRVNEALTELYAIDARVASVVEMRFFGGFRLREIATQLRVSLATIERDAARGRAILFALLSEE